MSFSPIGADENGDLPADVETRLATKFAEKTATETELGLRLTQSQVDARVAAGITSKADTTALATKADAGSFDSIDGTNITTSAALQSLVTTAAATGKAVRLKPAQVIAITSTITIPTQGGIVCDSAAPWMPNAPDAMRPQLVAQAGFSGPIIKVTSGGRCVRLRGIEIDGNNVTGVTYGILFESAGGDTENSHRLEDVGVRRIPNGTGIAGRIRTSDFQWVNVFQCNIGVQIGAAGPWYDTKWHGGNVAFCKTAGVEMTTNGTYLYPSSLLNFSNIRVERNGQIPFNTKNTPSDPNWNPNAPGWDIRAAGHCTWTACTTDANNGPGFKVTPTAAGAGGNIGNLAITACVFNRDGQGSGTSMGASTTGVHVVGAGTNGSDHVGTVRFYNCSVIPGPSPDDGSGTYSAPAYGLTVDHADHFVWIGYSRGVTKGINFGTKDFWKAHIADNWAQLFYTADAVTTTMPSISAN